MQEWNVVISVQEHGYRKALDLFADFGNVKRTDFFNVLLMRAEDRQYMLEVLTQKALYLPDSLSFLTRLIPVTHTFIFRSAEEFQSQAKDVVLQWVPELSGKNFHVRVYRRGLKGKISSPDVERYLDTLLREALDTAGTPGTISFEDADAVIVIVTIGNWAGLSLITSEFRERYPFVRVN